ncbi:MAG: hypothetical protein ACK4KV_22025 [Rhodocyclaceae bacterium]
MIGLPGDAVALNGKHPTINRHNADYRVASWLATRLAQGSKRTPHRAGASWVVRLVTERMMRSLN